MNLFILSDTAGLNADLNGAIRAAIKVRRPRIAYISGSIQSSSRVWFYNTVSDYKRIIPGSKLEYFDLSPSFSDEELNRILFYDVVHLSGGNTPSFLRMIIARRFDRVIRERLRRDSLTIGVSAGAVLLGRDISICANFDGARGRRWTKGLGQLPFDFYPHFVGAPEDRHYIEQYVSAMQRDVVVCPDGDGLRISHGEIKGFGQVERFKKVGEGVRAAPI